MAGIITKKVDAEQKVLILDAHTRQSLVVARSLGRKNIKIIAFASSDKSKAPVFHSRWCTEKIIVPFCEGTDEYASFLLDYVSMNQIKLIISSSDGTVTLLRKYYKSLSKYTIIALATEPGLSIALNKEKTLHEAKKLGIAIPVSYTIRKQNELKKALSRIELPAVVKPNESWLDAKKEKTRLTSVLVTTEKEAQQAVHSLTKNGGSVLFQNYLNGKREAVSLLYKNGNFYARFAQWAKRVQPPLGGQSVLRQSIRIPDDIGTQTKLLIEKINLEGYSEIEFRRDEKGIPYLMEINPRLSASFEIAVKCGIDYPYLIYQLYTGSNLKQQIRYKAGKWMRHLGGDIITTLQAIKNYGKPGISSPVRVISDFIATFFYPLSYDYIDIKDPMPMLYAIIGFFRELPVIYKNATSGRVKV